MPSKRFCSIVNTYCVALGNLIKDIQSSTDTSRNAITIRKYRSKRFDNYVLIINDLNNTMLIVAKYNKLIIISLHALFLYKKKEYILEFFEKINRLLIFLSRNKIFERLNVIRMILEQNVQKDMIIINKIDKIQSILFSIFGITLTITSMFVPHISFASVLIASLSESLSKGLDHIREEIELNNPQIEKIVKGLLDIELRSEILANLDIDVVYTCIYDKEAQTTINTIEELQKEYVELNNAMIELDGEIHRYMKKKKFLVTLFSCN